MDNTSMDSRACITVPITMLKHFNQDFNDICYMFSYLLIVKIDIMYKSNIIMVMRFKYDKMQLQWSYQMQ